MIPIVLTGTIVPNAIKTVHRNWKVRRNEYLEAITYYKKFSKVYFIENSHYDISHDSEFSSDERFKYFKFATANGYKGQKRALVSNRRLYILSLVGSVIALRLLG